MIFDTIKMAKFCFNLKKGMVITSRAKHSRLGGTKVLRGVMNFPKKGRQEHHRIGRLNDRGMDKARG